MSRPRAFIFPLAMLLIAPLFAPTGQAQPIARQDARLGRLFLSPAKRMQLEQQRAFNLQEQKTLEGATVRLDGVVVRSSGKKTVWINGRAQNDDNNELGIVTQVSPRTPGQAALYDGSNGNTRLRVGQEVNRATQEIHDGLDGGKVEVKPPSRKR